MNQEKNIDQLKEDLFKLLKEHSYKEGRVVLSSGKVANYYIDARVVTLSSEGAFLCASIILHLIRTRAELGCSDMAFPSKVLEGPTCACKGSPVELSAVGGPTLGADPFLGAISVLSFLDNKPLNTFIIRKSPKKHGTARRIEGPALAKGDKVVVLDDVATSGGSLVDCASVLKNEGIKVCGAIVIIDRCEGAKDALAKINCPLISIFKSSDFLKK